MIVQHYHQDTDIDTTQTSYADYPSFTYITLCVYVCVLHSIQFYSVHRFVYPLPQSRTAEKNPSYCPFANYTHPPHP